MEEGGGRDEEGRGHQAEATELVYHAEAAEGAGVGGRTGRQGGAAGYVADKVSGGRVKGEEGGGEVGGKVGGGERGRDGRGCGGRRRSYTLSLDIIIILKMCGIINKQCCKVVRLHLNSYVFLI